VRCPVCATDWSSVAASPTRCVCGYSFATGDASLAIETLKRTHRSTVRRVVGGVAMFGGGLLSFVLGAGALSTLYSFVFVLAGAALVVRNLPAAVRASGQMRDARALAKLPAARLLGAPRP